MSNNIPNAATLLEFASVPRAARPPRYPAQTA